MSELVCLINLIFWVGLPRWVLQRSPEPLQKNNINKTYHLKKEHQNKQYFQKEYLCKAHYYQTCNS